MNRKAHVDNMVSKGNKIINVLTCNCNYEDLDSIKIRKLLYVTALG